MFVIHAFVLSFAVSSICAFDRNVTSYINYNCSDCNSTKTTLIYIKGVGSNDTVHQIWDFTRGKPNILYSISQENSSLSIEWEEQKPVSFKFSTKPKYSFGVMIDAIWEFNDMNDTGTFDPSSSKTLRTIHSLEHMKWNRTMNISNEGDVKVEVVGYNYKLGVNASVTVKMEMLPFRDYADQLPHLLHTANSSLLDIQLRNLSTNFQKSRFALELFVVSTDNAVDNVMMKVRRGLDDEHTPGIFEIIELTTPESWRHDDGGYLQYRPIAYTKPTRSIQDSTSVMTGGFNHTKIPRGVTAGLFFTDYQDVLVENTLVSFGLSGDGFYKNTNYTAWACSIGYGLPPIEHFSLFVILTISFGLGIPILILLSGACYMCMRKRRERGMVILREEE